AASDGANGAGIHSDTGAVRARRIVIRDNDGNAVAVGRAGASLELTQAVLGEARTPAPATMGRGIFLAEGARGVVRDVRIDAASEVGLYGVNGAEMDISDVVIRDTVATDTGTFGRGFVLQNDAIVDAQRVLIEGVRDVGAFITSRSRLNAEDWIIRAVSEATAGGRGGGVEAYTNADVTFTRLSIEDV
ncbi:MAG: hypothetical protein GWN73_32700, partial [Actinobacteria bacterium]|nr:hypothetical protein [Actinomycetota bacterium]NIU69886.1 hypothetical protein [Actinomycetota bacterium]NIW31766.1 hypothetical protein [Actinomycetota bacterium]